MSFDNFIITLFIYLYVCHQVVHRCTHVQIKSITSVGKRLKKRPNKQYNYILKDELTNE